MDSDSEGIDDVLGPADNETVVDERKHNKLLDAISSLDGNKRHKLTQRTVFSNQISEFNFAVSKDAHSKVQLAELVGSLKESGSHGKLKNQLSTVSKKKQLVDVPLAKHEKEKIDRTTAYENTTTDLSKWDPVVRNNRQADHLQFPLQKSDVKLVSSQQFTSRFQPRTPLEMQVAALLRGSDNVIKGKQQELTPAEQRALRAMDLQEAQERRNELCKHRALLSYKEAKAKRQKKIKSKKYHRILKKERLRQESRDLEDMKTRDPDGYEEKVAELEKARIQERLTLKHRGGSKYARRQMMYSKYNDKARDQVQEMLQHSRELTKKTEVDSESDDPAASDDDLVGQPTTEPRTYKGDNPWMARPKPVTAKPPGPKSADSDSEDDEMGETGGEMMEGNSVTITDSKVDSDVLSDSKIMLEETVDAAVVERKDDDIEVIFSKIGKVGKKKNKKNKGETVQEEKSSSKKKQKEKKKKGKQNNVEVQGEKSEVEEKPMSEDDDNDDDDEGMISETLNRKRTLEEVEELLDTGETEETTTPKKKARSKGGDQEKKAKKPAEPSVDPEKLFTLETKIQQAGSGPEVIGDDDDDDIDLNEQQRMTIAQAFADDDVISEFRQDKKETEDRNKPADVDLFLPGWGSWGGSGLAPPKRKKKRFTIKTPAAPRQDMGLGNVIINENKSEAIKKHQVGEVPFPFLNADQFEYSIRAPVGRTWNPETAFQQLTKPKVTTQAGSVIAPMDKAEVFKDQKTKNQSAAAAKGNQSGGKSKFGKQSGKKKGGNQSGGNNAGNQGGQNKQQKGKGESGKMSNRKS